MIARELTPSEYEQVRSTRRPRKNNNYAKIGTLIAVAEGEQDHEPYNFDKSQLDQQILNCQNYGQQ